MLWKQRKADNIGLYSNKSINFWAIVPSTFNIVMRYTLTLLLLLLTFSAFSKDSAIDSLCAELDNANDSIKLTIYNELYSILRNRDTDSALAYIEDAIELATKINNTQQVAHFSVSYGYLNEHKGEIEKAIVSFEKAYNLYLQINNTEMAATALNNLGAMLNDAGRYNESSKHLFNALKLAEDNNYIKLTATIHNNIGLLFHFQDEWEKSINYFQKSIVINQQLNNLERMALLYNNIGIAYYYLDILDSVLISFERSLDIYIKLDNKKGQTRPLFNIGEIYSEKGDFETALEYYERSLTLEKEVGYMSGYATSLVYIGEIYSSLGDYSKAIEYQHEGIEILEKMDLRRDLLDAYEAITETFKQSGYFDSAFHYQTASISLKDSLFSLEKSKQISELETLYETEKKEQQIALQQTRIEFKNKQTYSLLVILLLTFGLTIYVIYTSRGRRKANLLLSEKNELLSTHNKLITNSITYGSFIQNTILPDKSLFEKVFKDSFIFYKPKDIVSGDFYWLSHRKDQIIIAVADCTGHGVPGAFMSLLGHSFLNEITDIQGITQPDKILNKLREKIIGTLKQKDSDRFSRDGIELAVCSIDTKNKQIDYSGAYSPVIVYSGKKITELKPNKMPIGFHLTRKSKFALQTISYKKGDLLYFFTDGYYDQFGGPQNKKYGQKRFKALIDSNHHLPMDEQLYAFEHGFKNWLGEEEQIDDVTVVGVKL